MAKLNESITIDAPIFSIGDRVYYNGIEEASMPGIVNDIAFSLRKGVWQYLVIFHPEIERWCYSDELLKKKRIV